MMKTYLPVGPLQLRCHKLASLIHPRHAVLLLIVIGTAAALMGCAGGSDSGTCQTTTQTDANGNPITTVGCN